jgi:hypothetical protein
MSLVDGITEFDFDGFIDLHLNVREHGEVASGSRAGYGLCKVFRSHSPDVFGSLEVGVIHVGPERVAIHILLGLHIFIVGIIVIVSESSLRGFGIFPKNSVGDCVFTTALRKPVVGKSRSELKSCKPRLVGHRAAHVFVDSVFVLRRIFVVHNSVVNSILRGLVTGERSYASVRVNLSPCRPELASSESISCLNVGSEAEHAASTESSVLRDRVGEPVIE